MTAKRISSTQITFSTVYDSARNGSTSTGSVGGIGYSTSDDGSLYRIIHFSDPCRLPPVLGGAGNLDDPTTESWGGSFRPTDSDRFPHYYVA